MLGRQTSLSTPSNISSNNFPISIGTIVISLLDILINYIDQFLLGNL